jgi:hypothetical protein
MERFATTSKFGSRECLDVLLIRRAAKLADFVSSSQWSRLTCCRSFRLCKKAYLVFKIPFNQPATRFYPGLTLKWRVQRSNGSIVEMEFPSAQDIVLIAGAASQDAFNVAMADLGSKACTASPSRWPARAPG